MNHREEVEKYITVNSAIRFVLLMVGLLQPMLFYIFTPDPYNVSIVGFATVIIIDIILIGFMVIVAYTKYHGYHITDRDL